MTALLPLRTSLGRNSGIMLLNFGGKMLLQGVYFVILARVLGASQYGSFVATTALVALLAPFGSVGAVGLLVRRGARDATGLAGHFSAAVGITVVASSVLAGLFMVAAPLLSPLGVSARVVALVVLADLFGARLIDVASAVFQAQERLGRVAVFGLFLHGGRLLGAVGLVVVPWPAGVLSWALIYACVSVGVALGVLTYTFGALRWTSPAWRPYLREWRDGLMFAAGLSTSTVYADADKVMLGRLDSAAAAGVYAAPYRVLDFAFAPVQALLAAGYARFFRAGAAGMSGAVAFARKLARPALAYCLLASALLFIGADYIPVLLGSSYQDSVEVVRMLAILPVLKVVHYLAGECLTGAGLQGTRTAIQIGVAAANIGLNLWLIPLHSWRGAAAATVVSEAMLALIFCAVVGRRLRASTARAEPDLHAAAAA
jgi:O-antigen/teichoic acid export membrane protein